MRAACSRCSAAPPTPAPPAPCAALVTAPVQKSVLMDAGIPFSGSHRVSSRSARNAARRDDAGRRRRGAPLRVALVTTHLALKDVPAAITRDAVAATLAIVAAELAPNSASPRRGSPCAGSIRTPAKAAISGARRSTPSRRRSPRRARRASTPPARCRRTPCSCRTIARGFDAIVAMYHDQGLPVLKAASFGHGVNVTLGLPFIRTSVDHGTALDLAADPRRAATADPGQPVRRGRSRDRAGGVMRHRRSPRDAADMHRHQPAQALRPEFPRRPALRRADRRRDRARAGRQPGRDRTRASPR